MSKTVAMDTVAVINNGRTYVPIRYVAEALGAYVDYSTTCKTVGIYNDVLSKEQIEFLISLDYAPVEQQYQYYLGYEQKAHTMEYSDVLKTFGTDREYFEGNFANSREHVYRTNAFWVASDYNFPASGLALNNAHKDGEYRPTSEFVDMALEEVRATFRYDCDFFSSEVLTDASCVYQGDGRNRTFLVRMIVKYSPKVPNPNQMFMSEEDTSHLKRLHLWSTNTMDTQYIVLDAFVTTSSDNVTCWAALPQTSNLSKETCCELGLEGGCDILWSGDSTYSGYVYELEKSSVATKTSNDNILVTVDYRSGDTTYSAIVSGRNIWVLDESGNGSWKTIDFLDYSTQLFKNDLNSTGLTMPIAYSISTPTQYQKIVAADGTVSYQYGQWQSKYAFGTSDWREFYDKYCIVVNWLNGKSSTTIERWEKGEKSLITYYAKDYPTADELREEYINSWVFVPGRYEQDSSGLWVFQPT